MQSEYNKKSTRRKNRAQTAAAAAMLIILLLLLLCIVELIVLASLNAKLRAAEKDKPEGTDRVESSTLDDVTAAPVNTEIENPAYLAETDDYGQDYIDKIIFIGDSTTYHLIYHGVLLGGRDTKQVWVPVFEVDGGKLPTLSLDIDVAQAQITYPRTGAKMTIPEAAGAEKPEYMVITLGINNGVPSLSEDKFKQCYRKLLDALSDASPDTMIILQSIFPVTSAYSERVKSITNDKINAANVWVSELAQEYNIKYLDTSSILKDTDGNLNRSYENGDGIHLNKSGYEAVLYYIRTHGHPKS